MRIYRRPHACEPLEDAFMQVEPRMYDIYLSSPFSGMKRRYRSNKESVMDKSVPPLNRMKVAVDGRQNVFDLNNKFNNSIHDRR